VELPINPIALALVSGATYVARGFSGDPKHMSELIAGGIQHKGFALIDVFSPCVTYNKVNTYPWFKQRVYKLDEQGDHDTNNVREAMEKSFEWGQRIPIGLFYKDEQPTYEDSEPVLKHGPLTRQRLSADPAMFRSLVEELM
jgi:2-oxoglutarate ferredoxin oxidoreductase subunit beta